jgi:hypothetical protein
MLVAFIFMCSCRGGNVTDLNKARPRKVRPRTSAWYSLHVDATRHEMILPDLPDQCRMPRGDAQPLECKSMP